MAIGMLPLVEMLMHIDIYLAQFIREYGLLVYVLLFLIIFLETGLVIFPFLPGDSLLFAAGALLATGSFEPALLFTVLAVAAIAGDTVNYWIGHKLGPSVFKRNIRFLKKEYLKSAENFYEKHGGKTIVAARFIPFIRTFAPFVAGIGKMNYRRFLSYNVIGGLAWVTAFLGAGYFFGNISFVKDNFGIVLLGIIVVTVLAAVLGAAREMRKKKK
jgi:membrane-associated protein